MNRGFEFRLLTTDGLEMNQIMPAATIMDRLAETGLSFRGDIKQVFDQLYGDTGGVSLTVVTGNITHEELVPLNRFRGRFEVITIVQFIAGESEAARGIPDANLISAGSSEEFARAWNQATRR